MERAKDKPKAKPKKKKWIVLLAVLFLALLVAMYAVLVEPRMLLEKQMDLDVAEGKPAVSLKIAQFSDTHLGPFYSLAQLKQVVKRIEAQQPDLIVFTGDLLDKPSQYTQTAEVAEILAGLHAPLGEYAVWGNHDYAWKGAAAYTKIMQAAGFTLLKNQSEVVQLPTGQTISITGLDDAKFGKPNLDLFARQPEEVSFRLLLSHAPDLAADLPRGAADLVLSGHSHGGQVNIPLLNKLFFPSYGKVYPKGLYEVGDAALYVTNGIGTTALPVRLFAPPEIVLFHIEISA